VVASNVVREVPLLFLCACASSPAPAPAPAPASDPAPASAAASDPAPAADVGAAAAATQLPAACAPTEGNVCTPPSDFVDRLCNGFFPDAALALFARDTPFTRGYLARNVDGWYTSGATVRAKLDFDEEVLVVRFRAPPKNGIIVGGSGGSYDVMRWDGRCYSLEASELTLKHPPRAKHPPIPFNRLGSRMRDALLANDRVKGANERRGKECKGVTTGDVSLACVRADTALGDAIVDYVRVNPLPAPEKIP
jgi:hypothetical protein